MDTYPVDRILPLSAGAQDPYPRAPAANMERVARQDRAPIRRRPIQEEDNENPQDRIRGSVRTLRSLLINAGFRAIRRQQSRLAGLVPRHATGFEQQSNDDRADDAGLSGTRV